MSKYKVGDKVKVIRTGEPNELGRSKYIGEVFTIESVNPNGDVRLDEHYGVEGKCPYIFLVDELEPYVEEKKVFTKSDLKNGDVIVRRNGSVEIAIVDRNVFITKHGWNKLADVNDDLTDIDSDFGDNEWDIVKVYRPKVCHQCQFETEDHGELVYYRERYTKKLYNGKVVCIENEGNKRIHTVGKIYQFKDGILCGDNGLNYPCEPYHNDSMKIHSFEEWADWTGSKFIEVVE